MLVTYKMQTKTFLSQICHSTKAKFRHFCKQNLRIASMLKHRTSIFKTCIHWFCRTLAGLHVELYSYT